MADNAIPKMLEALAELDALGVKPGDVVRYCRQTTTGSIGIPDRKCGVLLQSSRRHSTQGFEGIFSPVVLGVAGCKV